LPDSQLMRFVADPDGNVIPDVAASLPGRGMWVSADRASIAVAAAKNLFSKAAKAPLTVSRDLGARVEVLLVTQMQADLGLARRAGQLVLGFDNVLRALGDKVPPTVLVEACDGAIDGRRKLLGSVHAHSLKTETIDCLSTAELSLALGRGNVIHAALKPGRLAERLIFDAGRLRGFRPVSSADKSEAFGPAPSERSE
jgi:hypothetical protein